MKLTPQCCEGTRYMFRGVFYSLITQTLRCIVDDCLDQVSQNRCYVTPLLPWPMNHHSIFSSCSGFFYWHHHTYCWIHISRNWQYMSDCCMFLATSCSFSNQSKELPEHSHNILVQSLSGSADFSGNNVAHSRARQNPFNAVQTIFQNLSHNNTFICV